MTAENMYEDFYNSGNVKRRWDYSTPKPWIYYEFTNQGVQTLSRPFTAAENVVGQARLDGEEVSGFQKDLRILMIEALLQVETSIPSIQTDQDAATAQKTAVDAAKVTGVSNRSTMNAQAIPETFTKPQLDALKTAILQVMDQQNFILQTMSDGLAQRKTSAIDRQRAYRLIVWLARYTTGRLKD